MRLNYLFFIIICSFSFAILRKILPGQPVFIEPIVTVIVFIITLLTGSLKYNMFIPNGIKTSYKIWFIFLFIYFFLGIIQNYLLAFVSFFTKIVPLVMILVAFQSLNNKKSNWEKILHFLAIVSITLLPFAVYTAIYGSDNLPIFLRPTKGIIEIGKESRMGFISFSGFFTSNVVQGMSFMAIFHLLLAGVFDPLLSAKKKRIYILGLISSFLLVYLSSRRGAFYACVLSLGYILVISKMKQKMRIQIIIAILILVISFFYFDKISEGSRKDFSNRSDLLTNVDLNDRVDDIFVPFFKFWAEHTPWGTFLGASSPETRAFGIDPLNVQYEYPVETGAAYIISEMGILSAIIFPILVIYIIQFYWRFPIKQYRLSVNILLLYMLWFFILYYFKEGISMYSGGLHVLIFWAIPGISLALKTYK